MSFNNTANKITFLRIVLIPVFIVLLYLGLVYLSFAVYIIACASDIIDGHIARKYNQVTDFGKFIDPLADKMLVLSALCYFVETGLVPGWLVAIVLLREFAVSGLRLLAVKQGIVIAAAPSGKIKTLVTMIAVGTFILVGEPWAPFPQILTPACIIGILVTTVYSGFDYFIANRNVFNNK